MTNKAFDFTALPYDIRWIIYPKLSVKDVRTMFLVCKKFASIPADFGGRIYYREWMITSGKQDVDVQFHRKALSSSRMRNFTEHLQINFNFLSDANYLSAVSELGFAVSKMSKLQSLLVDCSAISERYHSNNGNGSRNIDNLISYMLSNDRVEELSLVLKNPNEIKPTKFQFDALLDRYPNLKVLAVRFLEHQDDDLNVFIELLLASLPLQAVVVVYRSGGHNVNASYKVFKSKTVTTLEKVGGQHESRSFASQLKHFKRLIQ